MKKILAMAAIALLATACGASGGKAAYVAACVKQGQANQKTCECVGDKLEKTLDADMFRAVALQAEGKVDEAQKIIDKVPMDKRFNIGMSAAQAAVSCIGQ